MGIGDLKKKKKMKVDHWLFLGNLLVNCFQTGVNDFFWKNYEKAPTNLN